MCASIADSGRVNEGQLGARRWFRDLATSIWSSETARARVNRAVTFLWLVLLASLATWVAIKGRSDLVATARELRQVELGWIGMAVLIQTALLLVCALTYRVLLRRLGHRLPFWRLLDAHMQRSAISVVAPAGGPASVYVFMRYVGRQGVPAEDSFLTIAVRSASATITFVAVLIPAALVAESLAGGLVAVSLGIGLLLGGIALARGERDGWTTPMRWSRRLPAFARWRVQSFITNFRDHGLKPIDLVPPIVFALMIRAGVVGVLWACLHALGTAPSANIMVNTYFASLIAATIVPAFGGAGAVEAVSLVALRQAGVPNEIAIGTVLLWRLIDFWIPVGIGLILHAVGELPIGISQNDRGESRALSLAHPQGSTDG